MSPLLCHILFLIFHLHPISVGFAFGVPYSPFFFVPWSSNQFTFTSPHIVDCLLIWCCPQGWERGHAMVTPPNAGGRHVAKPHDGDALRFFVWGFIAHTAHLNNCHCKLGVS